jgi:uncharacterized membrane protein
MIPQSLFYESGLLWAFMAIVAAVVVRILLAIALSPREASGSLPPREQERLRQRFSTGEITLEEYYRRTRGGR